MFISHSFRVQRFVALRNIEIENLLVLIQLDAVRKDLTDLSACGVMKLL